MTTQNNILVPIDFSELSLNAVREAFKFARIFHAKINLLNVSEKVSIETEVRISKLAKDFEAESGLDIKGITQEGNIFEKINEVANKVSAKLIVMGLNPSSLGIKHVLVRNPFKLIRKAKCPVITIKEKPQHDECKNIVLPLDLTKESREKVSRAVELARHYNASISIISVFAPNEERLENKLLAYTHQVKKFIKEKGVPCTNKTVEGNNRAEIVIDYANKIKADLIIITTQFESSLKEIFKGTVSQQIVNLSNTPVMSLPPIQRKDTTAFASPY